jgi:hypothetical protein
MAHQEWVLALGIIAAASPATANQGPDPYRAQAAPAGNPETRYCMRIEAVTGTRLEEVKCWTREEWAERGVDVDMDWAKEGVRVIG